jgi:hypothetical protein
VAALGLVEQQRPRERLDDLRRRPADAALLQTHQVVGADVGELGELLAAQAGDAATGPAVEPRELRGYARAAAAQELPQLGGALHRTDCDACAPGGTRDTRNARHWMRTARPRTMPA